MKKFSLHGRWNDKNGNGNIIATGCYLSSLSSQENIADSKMAIVMAKGEFQTDYVLFFPEALDEKLDKDLFIRFGIINVHKVFRVEVDTNLGILQLVNYSGIDERIRAMGSYNIPLITSVVDIFPNPINFNTVRDIV